MNVLDLFCGCGGFSLGFEQANHKVKYAIDNWKGCKETFEHSHPHTEFILEDIYNLKPEDFKNMEIVIGSPPCQQFSVANRNPNPKAGMKLVIEFLRWIKIIKPKYWIMENVPGIKQYLTQIKGFQIPFIRILNCANYGVPQKRKRCFSGNFKKPIPTHAQTPSYTLMGGKQEKWQTVLDAIGDIMFIEPNQEILIKRSKEFYTKHKQNIKKVSNQITTKDDCLLLNHQSFDSKLNPVLIGKYQSYKTLENNKPSSVIDVGKGMSPLINHECFDNIKDWNFDLANKKVKLKQPSVTIIPKLRCNMKLPILSHTRTPETTGANSPFYTSNNPARTMSTFPHSIMKDKKKVYRRLTVRECARLQSFPDDFIFFGSLSGQYKMIGNAVPPLMAYHLGKELK